MNWPRTILDGIAMSLFFNALVGLGFLLVPQAYTAMFPKEIKEAAAPYVNAKDVRTVRLILYPMYLVMFVYWGVSAHFAGVRGFWPLFWTGYVEMCCVSLSDFFILDVCFPPLVKHMIKGAERCKAWARKEWLVKLAIPEHFILWPLAACPVAALIVAGIGALLNAL